MNPLKSDNIVAKVLQVYAYINAVAGLLVLGMITNATGSLATGFIFFAFTLVASFLIFALGEIIDLLDTIWGQLALANYNKTDE